MNLLSGLKNKIELECDKIIAKRQSIEDIIFFESAPDFSDNSRFVFEEMIRRDYNRNYKLFWAVENPEKFKDYDIPNVSFIKKFSKEWKEYTYKSKVLISCNQLFYKAICRPDQICVHLCHGTVFKSCGPHVYLPNRIDYVNYISHDFMKEIGPRINNISKEKAIFLGYPRNDIFFDEKIDIHNVFPENSFDKCIVWLPTFRQNKANTRQYSSISQPIIHNVEDAKILNDYAREKNILIVLKPHFNQNMDAIKKVQLENLLIIDDEYLFEKGVILYQVLAASDAMLTDYSSVYYDYLNADKPIGLCWEDFDEFNERDGFEVDLEPIIASSEMVNTMDDMYRFIDNISNGVDLKRVERNKYNDLVNPYHDGNSSKRVVDFIEEKLSSL